MEGRSRKRGTTAPTPLTKRGSEQASRPPPDGGSPKAARFLRTQQCVRTHPSPPRPSSHSRPPKGVQAVPTTRANPGHPISQCSTNERVTQGTFAPDRDVDPNPSRGCDQMLLRKEVIQPHLPVRLPCYDFVPIASPTFDRSPQQAGWATGFGCCRLS
jgi:hypothetical protein